MTFGLRCKYVQKNSSETLKINGAKHTNDLSWLYKSHLIPTPLVEELYS